MCGRFVNNLKIEVQAQRFRAKPSPATADWQPTYNATPSRSHPVVVEGSERHLDLMAWGWKPSFGFLVNAIGEEAFEKKTFADSIRTRRCLVPATAFYEWTPPAGKQRGIPHAFRLSTEAPFAVGGIWRMEDTNGQQIASFLLLTTPANAVVARVHHRMALIIPPDREDQWLDPNASEETIRALIAPFPSEQMTAYRVGPTVNKAGTDGPQLLEPVVGETQQTLFDR